MTSGHGSAVTSGHGSAVTSGHGGRPRVLRVAIVCAFFALSVAGCERSAPPVARSLCTCDEPGKEPVDQQLVAWLSKARTLHHLADLGEADGALDRAITSLDQLLTGATPSRPSPEVDEVMADSYARVAELRVRRGELARADEDTTKGLERAKERTYFRGHLFEVRGLVYEKMGESLAKAGKGAEAEEARQKAVRSSSEAVRLQDEVIERALADAGSP